MKRRLLAFCTAGLMVLTISCAQAPQPSQPPDTHDADIQGLKDNEAQWNKEYETKDVEKIVAHYADDAVLMSPGSPAASGKDAIRSVLKEMVGDSAFSLKFQPARVDVAKSGDLAYTRGAYTITLTDPATKKPINDKGSYVTVYRKAPDGSWKAVSDIATSSAPPGQPAAPKQK